MKVVGALLIMLSALWIHYRYLIETVLPLRLARALASDLAVLRRTIVIDRRPIPEILERELNEGIGAEYFWEPFRRMFSDDADMLCASVRDRWQSAITHLPNEVAACLVSIGPHLTVGGDTFVRVVDEAREALLCIARDGEAKRSAQMRLSAAFCLSGACFLIMILL